MRNCLRAGKGSLSRAAVRPWYILENAKGFDVRSTIPSKVRVYEFTTKQERAKAAKNASNPAEALRRFEEDSWRIFRIKADAPVGIDKARVEAKNTKTGRAEGNAQSRRAQ